MSAANIAAALGGTRSGRGFVCRCPVPGHGGGRGDRHPSLSVSDGDQALLVHCHAGCDPLDILDELRRRSLLPDPPWRPRPASSRKTSSALPTARPADDDAKQRTAIALRIWAESISLSGTLGAAYFSIRRVLDLDGLGNLSHCLRWHPGKRMIVALMTCPGTNEDIGIHRTFLNADGSKRDRKMLGRAGVIRLSRDADVTHALALSEGVEDGLAVMLSGWRPIWCACTRGGIASFPVLPGIEALTIFADADTPGMEGAKTCADRWKQEGREATILPPRREALCPIDGDF